MRRGRRASSVLAVLALLATGCLPDGWSDSGSTPEALGLDQATTRARLSPTAPVDPASGLFTRTWRADLRGEFAEKSTRYTLSAGQLLVISKRGVHSIATANGARRWHYRETRRQVGGHALTAETFVLVTWGPNNDPRTIGLNAVTGEQLWTSTDYRPIDGAVQPAGRGIVALADSSDRSTLVGIDARTGKRRWTWPGPERPASREKPCRYIPHDSDGGLMLIHTICHPWERLYALDPTTGKPLWQRVSHPTRHDEPSTAAWATSRAGLTLIPEYSHRFQGVILIDRNGREQHRLESKAPESGSLAIARGRAVIDYQWAGLGSNDLHQLASVDLRTGKASKPIRVLLAGRLAAASGRVYVLRAGLGSRGDDALASDQLLAGGLEIIDPRTLRRTRVPLPSAGSSGFWSNTRSVLHTHVLLDGGRAYTAAPVKGGLRLTGYTPRDRVSPHELGGVPARDWPDACEIGRGVIRLKGRIVKGTPPGWPLEVGAQRLHGSSCSFDWVHGVSMAWVARTPAEADQLLEPEGVRLRPIPGLGDEAYGYETTPPAGDSVILVRVGRYVAEIQAMDKDPRPLADVVARNLKRLS